MSKPALSPALKFALDLAPLLVFFTVFKLEGLITATLALVVVSLVSVAITYALTRTVSLPVLIGTALVVLFGGLTWALNDETFIKLRPTLVNLLFCAVLWVGAFGFKRGLLRYILEVAFSLTDEGWRVLSIRWGGFFLFLAAANELVWRTQSTEFWVNYKVFGVLAMTMLFAVSQFKAMEKYKKSE